MRQKYKHYPEISRPVENQALNRVEKQKTGSLGRVPVSSEKNNRTSKVRYV
jgi:hypothetical protein